MRVRECRPTQGEEAVDVPVHDVLLIGVDVDGEVEEIAQRQPHRPIAAQPGRLQDVETLDDEDVGLTHHSLLASDNVVLHVGVDRCHDLRCPGLHVHDEFQQGLAVIGLREALAVQDAVFLEHGIGIQETVSGHQVHLGTPR